jgi:hypothetical protein
MRYSNSLGGLALLSLLALAPRAGVAQSSPPPQAAKAPQPARLTTRQLAQLRWIVGDWRGSGTNGTVQSPFYERYRFVDDSTLLVESFADSTFGLVTETARWELRGGRLANAGTGAQWVAVRLDSRGADFAPVARARNTFRWARAQGAGARPAEWRATISPTENAAASAQKHYRMQRVR